LWFVGHVVKAQNPGCPKASQTPEIQEGENNYVIDLLGGVLPFAYAIDVCTNINLQAPQYTMYTCKGDSNAWEVIKTSYGSDSTCQKAEATENLPMGAPQGLPGYFMCDGQNSFVELTLALGDPSCKTGATVFGGLNGCVSMGSSQINLFCEDTSAVAQIFLAAFPTTPGANIAAHSGGDGVLGNQTSTFVPSSSLAPTGGEHPNMCDPRLFCSTWNFAQTCGFVTELLGFNVYGLMDKCLPPVTTTTTSSNNGKGTTTKSSLRVQFALSNILLALVVPLFWLL